MKILFYVTVLLVTSLNLSSNECLEGGKKLFKERKYSESILKTKNCLQDIIDSKNKKDIKDAYFGLGVNYYNIGELDSALKFLQIAEEVNSLDEDIVFSADLFNEISIASISKGLNHNALYYLKKSLKKNIELKRDKSILKNYINLGTVFFNLNKLDSSEFYFKQSLKFHSHSNSTDKDIILNNLSIIYFKRGDINKAISTLKDVINNMTNANKLDSLYYMTNLDMVLIYNSQAPLFESKIRDYLSSTEKNNSLNADANFKASIYSLGKNNFKEGIEYLNIANTIYVSNNNLADAIHISSFFRSLLQNNNRFLPKLDGKISELKVEQAEQYSNLLIQETTLKTEIEESILILDKELEIAWASTVILLVVIFSLLLLILMSFKYVITSKKLLALKLKLLDYNNQIKTIHDRSVKNNLGKFISLMVISKKFDNELALVETIDDLVEGSNELSLFLNNINRSIYADTTTTNELSMERK